MPWEGVFASELHERLGGFSLLEEATIPMFITIGYGDQAGYDRTSEAARKAAHEHDAALLRRGVTMGIAGKPVQVMNPEDKGVLTKMGPYHVASLPVYQALPRGPVHADLFRDTVMFDGEILCGFFDFYFAGNDSFLFDLAVTLNDWCIFHGDAGADGLHDEPRAQAMLAAYQAVRPLTPAERQLLPAMLRAGALRFWISRLWDWHLPREAAMLKPHDPTHFERVLHERVRQVRLLSASLIEDGGVPA